MNLRAQQLYFLWHAFIRVVNSGNVNLSETYINLSLGISEYFASACTHLLTQNTDKDVFLLKEISKAISQRFWKAASVSSFDDYFQYLMTTSSIERCNVPLQVILSSDMANRQAFIEHSHRTSMHGTDQYGGGVWLLFLDFFDESLIEEYFRNINTPFDVELIVAWIDNPKEVHLKEIYRVRPGYPLRQFYFGNWTSKFGFSLPSKSLHYSRRTDLEGLKMKVGFVHSPPNLYLKVSKEGKHLEGYFGDVWQLLKESINVSPVLYEETQFGEKSCDNSWNGLLGMIHRAEVDVGVSDFSLTRSKFDIADFTFPILKSAFQMYFKHPGSKAKTNALLLPLGTYIWLAMVASLIVGTIVMFGGCYISDYAMTTNDNYTLRISFFFVLGVFCGQGTPATPKTTSCKLLFFLPFVIAAVVIPAYSASLVSFLTVTTVDQPFTTLKEFYENKDYTMIMMKSTTEYEIFSQGSSSDAYLRLIFERDLKGKNLLNHYEESISALCSNRYLAYFALEIEMQWILDNAKNVEKSLNDCIITSTPNSLGQAFLGMVFPKQSHFRGLINHHLRNLQASGVIDRIQKKYWINHKKTSGEVWTPVNMESLLLMFSVLGCGIILGLLAVIGEILF